MEGSLTMSSQTRISDRIRRRVRTRNREFLIEAAIEAALGVVFSLMTFGLLFLIALYVLFRTGAPFGLTRWQFALILSAIAFVVCLISAWRRENPFEGLKPMTDAQMLMTLISQAAPGYVNVNRHAVAGMAMLLLGGPANLVSALGTWCHRLPSDRQILDQAAEVLSACNPELDLESLDRLRAALLLRRLGLIIPRGDSTIIMITDKGRAVRGKERVGEDRG